MAEELLAIQPVAEHYAEMEKQLKGAMVDLAMPEIVVAGKGRVFISTSERTTITPDLARQVLGALANKVIEVKESVSNKLVEALVKMGEIDKSTQEQLQAGAIKTPVTALYVRPLK
jgi:hypothetical protein